MADIQVTVLIDEELKREAEQLFAKFGLSLNTAINLFLKQCVQIGRLPFEISQDPNVYQIASDSDVEKISQKLMEENKETYRELAHKDDKPH